MLDLLTKYLNDNTIFNLLKDPSKWDSIIVNRRKPHTYRVFTYIGDNRICLHKFDTCNTDESFAHPHPWPGAFFILKGAYKMRVGLSNDRLSKPLSVAEFIMSEGSSYEIVNPNTWHSVSPLCETYTIMINGPAWTPEIAHAEVRTTKGKDLSKMSSEDLQQHLDEFLKMLSDK